MRRRSSSTGRGSAARLAGPFHVSRPTICDYVMLLARVFLLEELPPWHTNRLSRLVKTPKLHLGDTGLACALLGIGADDLKSDRALLGQLLETFVFQEIKCQASGRTETLAFSHFRDRDGFEVDIVIERGLRALAGVEVKVGGHGHGGGLSRVAKAARRGGQAVRVRRGAVRRRDEPAFRGAPVRGAAAGAVGGTMTQEFYRIRRRRRRPR